LNPIEQLSARVRDAARDGQPLCITGSGSKSFYGLPASGEPLLTSELSGIVSYEPTELVIRARAGTPLGEIESVLAQSGQMLAFEPPHFGAGATLGGCIAAGLSGPARASAGPLRDFMLGVSIIDGRGEHLNFGGQVMKNVAGYDIARVMSGSLGTLGIVVDVSLKVLPRPAGSESFEVECTLDDALARFRAFGTRSIPVTATAWHDGRAWIRTSGSRAALAAAAKIVNGTRLDEDQGAALWLSLREQTFAFFAPGAPLWRIALPIGAPPLALGAELVEWRGMQRWIRSGEDAATIRARAEALGGHATLFRASPAERVRLGVFTPLAPALWTLHQRLKKHFDPAGVFNPGRMYPAL